MLEVELLESRCCPSDITVAPLSPPALPSPAEAAPSILPPSLNQYQAPGPLGVTPQGFPRYSQPLPPNFTLPPIPPGGVSPPATPQPPLLLDMGLPDPITEAPLAPPALPG